MKVIIFSSVNWTVFTAWPYVLQSFPFSFLFRFFAIQIPCFTSFLETASFLFYFWKQIYLINSQNIILNCNQMFQCLHKEMSFHFLPFHMWPGVHVYVMRWSVIDYNTGETLNKPTDIFGQVAHSLDLYFIVFYFLVVENMFE